MSLLQVSGIGRKEQGADVLTHVSFSQQAFQNIAIAGATGSGKTTLLKIIAGLVQPHAGEIWLEEEKIKGPEEKLIPGHPRIGYLSQYFELRNHYHVEELLQMSNQLPEEEAAFIYELCRIGHLLKRWTHQLSGGEKQRIALARLLVSAPKLLLLDEPYSNLDAMHKSILKSVVHDISEHLQITSILVSHDPSDTLSWADEIMILKEGGIVQKGTPEVIYKEPVSEYAAALFGKYTVLSPAMAKVFAGFSDIEMKNGRFIRPEDFRIVPPGQGVQAVVKRSGFMGSYYEIELDIGEARIVTGSRHPHQAGELVYLSLTNEA